MPASTDLSNTSPTPSYSPLHLDQVLPTDGETLRAPDVSPLQSGLARRLLRLLGWRIYGQFPNFEKGIIIAYPHTSNWDGILMLLTSWSFGVRPDWMVKMELMRSPLGPVIRWLGAIGIDRRASHDTVRQAADQIKASRRMMLVIAPEGTRRKTDHWKAGFYWIAHQAEIPVICAFIDYRHSRIGIATSFIPTGDIQTDLEPLFTLYRPMIGRHPEKMSDLRLRPTQQHDSRIEQA